MLVGQSLKFAFKVSNNQAEYKALIVGMHLATNMEVRRMIVRSDSQVVTVQVVGNFQAKDSHLVKYLAKVRSMVVLFEEFGLMYVSRDQNAQADFLSKLASTKRSGNH